jgi:hypothetical protein
MAYVISEAFYTQLKDTVNLVGGPEEEQSVLSQISPKTRVPKQCWFRTSSDLYCGQPVSCFPCNPVSQEPDATETVHFKHDLAGNEQVIVWDTLLMCESRVPSQSLIQAVFMGEQWVFIRSENGTSGGSLLGKTSTAWTKGSSQAIPIYTGAPGSEIPLQVKDKDGVTSTYTVLTYNRYQDIAADKWVRVTPGGELLTAEC